VFAAERYEEANKKGSEDWTRAAIAAATAQRVAAVEEGRLALHRTTVALQTARQTAETAEAAAAAAAAETGLSTNQSPARTKGATSTTSTTSTNTPTTKGTAVAAAGSKAAATTNAAVAKAARELETARQKQTEAEKALATAEKNAQAPETTAFASRAGEVFPHSSTGRRSAFARWIIDSRNPLTARVAVNHIWMRHFGRGLVATPTDFGPGGRAPTHPALLDWLAAEFMERGWSMKALHRLMVTSSTYRMASTPDAADEARDPDNVWLWRMPSRRLEAEAIRDNLLYLAGDLDQTMGGPDIDHNLGLSSRRRSLYLRLAAEKEVEFLRIFDGPTVTECYERRPTVMPQQALALGNSEIALRQASHLTARLERETAESDAFIDLAYRHLLARRPKAEEMALCREFLSSSASTPSPAGTAPTSSRADNTQTRRRQNLILVLMNHNDFVTIR
jgi:hypothetical protein